MALNAELEAAFHPKAVAIVGVPPPILNVVRCYWVGVSS